LSVNYRSITNVPEASPERVSIRQLFDHLATIVAANWHSENLKINFAVSPENLEVIFDRSQLEQALINLIKNAIEACENTPIIEIEVSAKLTRGERLRIEIQDNGPGVSDALIPQIFTPFFTTKEKGSGIGLALVRQLVQGNGGTIRYARAIKGGARFILTI